MNPSLPDIIRETITAARQNRHYVIQPALGALSRPLRSLTGDPITPPGILSKTVVPGESSATVKNA